jgi:XTP/dITP diphosphohydrolase
MGDEAVTRLVLASANHGKVAELQRMLADLPVSVVGMDEVGLDSPVEDGATFEDNALLKARAAATGAMLPAIADDSGLEVDALAGEPGVHSARWAGAHGADEANNDLLLERMEGVEDRAGRFVSAVAVAMPDGRAWVVRGTMEGEILHERHGTGGFGYDPLFRATGQDRSNGELDPVTKDRLSHRGAALRAILPVLEDLFPPA